MSLCLLKFSRCLQATKRPLGVMFFSDKGGNSGGDDESKPSAKDKLNALLQSIVKENSDPSAKEAKDTQKQKPGAVKYKLAKPIDEEKSKLIKAEREREKQEKSKPSGETEETIGPKLMKAVKDVAENIPGGDPEVVESELVQKLKTQNNNKVNLSDIFAGMKIDKTKKTEIERPPGQGSGMMETSRADRVRRIMEQRRPQHPDRNGGDWSNRRKQNDFERERRRQDGPRQAYVSIDIFGQSPLGIFSIKPKEPSPNVPVLSTWDVIHQRELKLAVTHPPANGFEEMILLTEKGKLWKFPIDNDQGRDDEANVAFHEHIFLEPLIESWCPNKGPIRHFMELVCVGLSKNAWLSVKEKHDHLEWYHQYFLSKAAIIKEVGAGEIK